MAERDPIEPTVIFKYGQAEGAAADADLDLPQLAAVPERIGRYRVERLLGQGGFGLVYRAHDDQLQRLVAIKVPHSRLVAATTDAAAYLKEARAVANLDHPHIVPVYDVGSTDEFPCYIVSKFIDGTDLATRLHQARFSLHEAVELVALVAEALHHAHRQGLVHRDIKPGNILLDRYGKPFVGDFGLALREQDVGTGPRHAGTPAYMSPEQARGEGHRVDGRSDIFSLGVLFYELLVGRRPFRADTKEELLEQITSTEVKPPRQIDDAIPKELDRICLKALSKRASERYSTATDLADDLRHFLARATADEKLSIMSHSVMGHAPGAREGSATEGGTPVHTPTAPPTSERNPIRIVPKGLRSFDEHDADFFLELIPGPRDRDGLPDGMRFWKTRIEERDADKTFAAGLIYGPSGCGKSSLVKAGLLPRLSKDVMALYVEASADQTELRLLNSLRKCCAGLPGNLNLTETLAMLRRGQGFPAGKKLLIVLDQFEQWLHARKEETNAPLVHALRQCDGGRLQCLIMVRDDFWMAATRLMRELEVRLVEGQNSAAIDLFDMDHARKVLAAFGRAFGKLPENAGETNAAQKEFLKQAVTGLAQDGKVVSVRLALFAEMMKGKPWTPASLKAVGGTQGVGVAFLEETFSAAGAPPEHRYHQQAARAVLKALLPEPGTDIKGHMRSQQELLALAGHANRPRDFDDLIHILDSEIRLITPADSAGGDEAAPSVIQPGAKYYQLTHDYLVPSLRDWLTGKLRETRRGRADLLLSERTVLWESRRERKQLPTFIEWLTIATLTRRRDWTSAQRQMMAAAGRHHVLRCAAALTILALLTVLTVVWRNRFTAESLVERLVAAEIAAVPDIVAGIDPYRTWTDPVLAEHFRREKIQPRSPIALRASLGLLPAHPEQADYLLERLLEADVPEFDVLARTLLPHAARLHDRLWTELQKFDRAPTRQLRAACALAEMSPADDRWPSVAPAVASILIAQNSLAAGIWAERLRPVSPDLVAPLTVAFQDRDPERANDAALAAEILLSYSQDDTPRLVNLLVRADRRLFPRVLSNLTRRHDAAERLLSQLTQSRPAEWLDQPPGSSWTSVDAALTAQIEAAGGTMSERFAFCQTLPLDQAAPLAEALRGAGYRPMRWRPHLAGAGVEVAAVWARDGVDWQLAVGLDLAALQSQLQAWSESGFVPVDVAGYISAAGQAAFAALSAPGGGAPPRVLLQVADADLPEQTGQAQRAGFAPATAQRWLQPDGTAATNMIWTAKADVGGSTYSTFASGDQLQDWQRDISSRLLQNAVATDVVTCAASPADSQARDASELNRLAQAATPDEIFSRALASFRLGKYESAAADLTRLAAQGDLPAAGFWREKSWKASDRAVVCDDWQPRSGHAALRLTATTPNDVSAVQVVPVRPWSRYLYSGWIRTRDVRVEQPQGRFAANLCLDYAGTERSASFDGTQDWRYATIVFHSREREQVELRVRLGHTGSTSTGTAWFDELCLVELSSEEVENVDRPEFLTPARRLRNLLYNGECEGACADLYEYLGRSWTSLSQLDKAEAALARLEGLGDHSAPFLRLRTLLGTARVGIEGGEAAESIRKLESYVSERRDDDLIRYGAARTFAAMASQVAAAGGKPGELAAQAIDLLRPLAEQSPEWLATIEREADFRLLMAHPQMVRLFANRTSSAYHALVWREDHAWESKISRGTESSALRDRHAALAADGFRPVAISTMHAKGRRAESTLIWARPAPSAESRAEDYKQQANALVGLVQLGLGAQAWPLLADSAAPERQSQASQRLAQYGVLPETLFDEIRSSNDDSLRRILILGLGEFEFGQLGQPLREKMASELVALYRDHPDPGIHGAAEWCLSRWNLRARLASATSDLRTGRLEENRRWYLARNGQTFAVCQGGTFLMGSPADEKWRIRTEAQHAARIDRKIAAATTLVTVEQFQRFLRERGIRRRFDTHYSPESDCPQTEINWFDAVQYCNWLSEHEDIPRSQWCYEPKAGNEYAPGMKLAENYLARTGYRLPSEAEWEFLCRAGSTTARYFGDSDELLPRFAWFNQNSRQHSWPVGRLKPNAFGLFDMLGNTFQWCQDAHGDYPAGSLEVEIDRERSLVVDAGADRIIRGGAFNRDAATLRSAARNMEHPGFRNYPLGFRVVRTYP